MSNDDLMVKTASPAMVPHGIPLEKIIAACKQLTVAELKQQLAPAFFVIVTGKPEQPLVRGATQRHSTDDERTGDTHVYFLPLVRKDTNRSTILRLGRGESCDIVIADVTVSKLHAFIQPEADGQYSLLDAGSHNGTFIGDDRIAARGTGDPTLLRPGVKVRFGWITTTFVDVSQLHSRLVRERKGA